MRVRDFRGLLPGQWLNDEIINNYISLISNELTQRAESEDEKNRVVIVSTFFYTIIEDMLNNSSYSKQKIERNLKKSMGALKSGKCELMLIPINSRS